LRIEPRTHQLLHNPYPIISEQDTSATQAFSNTRQPRLELKLLLNREKPKNPPCTKSTRPFRIQKPQVNQNKNSRKIRKTQYTLNVPYTKTEKLCTDFTQTLRRKVAKLNINNATTTATSQHQSTSLYIIK